MRLVHFFLFDHDGVVTESEDIGDVAMFKGPWAYSVPTAHWYSKDAHQVGWTKIHASLIPSEIRTKLLLLT